jgi:hypothetical protein
MKSDAFSDKQYGLLFDVRRSVRYHDRRRAFYEQMHHLTGVLTILMAGSVLFDLAKDGATAGWLVALSVMAAVLSAADMVLGYSRCAARHDDLRKRFADLEIAMLDGGTADPKWQEHHRLRLLIEKDEPAIYKIVDLLCRNELLVAERFTRKKNPEQFARISVWQRLTSQIWRWDNWQARPNSEQKPQV